MNRSVKNTPKTPPNPSEHPKTPPPSMPATLTFPPLIFTPGIISDICIEGTRLKKTSNT